MFSLFAMPFFFRAFVALAATGAAFPVLGTFILNLEMIPARFAVMHAAFLGAAAGMLVRIDPMAAAMGASVLAGIAIALLSSRGRVSAGGSLGLVMTVSMGLAYVILHKGNIRALEAFNLFWGSVLALTAEDTLLTLCVAGAVLLFLAAAYKEIQIVLYDRELAWAVGVPAKLVYAGIILAVCLGIAAALRVTGALLIDALTILPALAARETGKNFRGLVLWGMAFGLGMNMGGFGLAFLFDLPVGPAIILVGAGIVFALKGRAAFKKRRLQA
jgi:zinc transport system permease protein